MREIGAVSITAIKPKNVFSLYNNFYVQGLPVLTSRLWTVNILATLQAFGDHVWGRYFQPKLAAGSGAGVKDLRHDGRPTEREADEGWGSEQWYGYQWKWWLPQVSSDICTRGEPKHAQVSLSFKCKARISFSVRMAGQWDGYEQNYSFSQTSVLTTDVTSGKIRSG